MLSGICFLLSACSEQEDYENLINNAPKEKDLVEVNLRLSLQSEMKVEGNTDYHPMSTRAEGDGVGGKINALIDKKYNCLVMKEINNVWYVDTLVKPTLSDESSDPIQVMDDSKFKNLQLTLRPGHYRILAVLNPNGTKWNGDLKPGTVVKREGDTVACAYTYRYVDRYETRPGNPIRRFANKEIFVGTADFNVNKTEDLHSASISGDTKILFTRRVMKMRFLLKNHKSELGNFIITEEYIDANISTTEDCFCDGLDCWGDAYYNHQKPTKKIELYLTLKSPWRTAKNQEQYMMIAKGSHTYSPFVFTDPKKTVTYQMEDIRIIGQSGTDQKYAYPSPIQDLKLRNDTIQQLVFQMSDECTPGHYDDPDWYVILDYLEKESNMDLFDNNYECNHP